MLTYFQPDKLLKNIRFYILIISVVISLVVWNLTSNETIRTDILALLAVSYLYFALLITPLTKAFPKTPFRSQLLKARRAIGVSAFYFALFHAYNSFFFLLGGFPTYFTLPLDYLAKTFLGIIALFILFLMAITSFDYAVAKLTFKKWKLLHRMVYIAGMLIIIHALLLGSNFQDLNALIPQIFYVAFCFLMVLEVYGLEKMYKAKHPIFPRFILLTITIGILLFLGTFFF